MTYANATTAPNAQAQEATDATKVMLEQHTQLKEGCSIVGYEIRNWSGKKTFSEGKVTALDNSGQNVELPSDLVSPGRKSLLDTRTHLSFCNQFSSRMSRLFNKYGVKFFGNYLVSDALLPELMKEAKADIAEYEAKVEDFCGKYEQLIAEWCGKHPGLESVIRDGYMTVEEVRSRFRLRMYKPMRFTPRVEEDLSDMVGEAAAQLFEDISKEAQSLLKDSLTIKEGAAKGSYKESCTQDIKRPLRRLRDKVFSLYMLDSVFEGVVDVFDDLLDKALPQTGKIKGSHFSVLMQHVMLMTDPHRLKLHASGVNQIAQKVAEVEQAQEEEEVADAAEQAVSDIDDEEAQLLAQLEAIRRKKATKAQQQAQAIQPQVEAKPIVEAQPEPQSQVEAPVIEEPVVVEQQPVTTDNPVVDEVSAQEQPTVVMEDVLLSDELEISIDTTSLEVTKSVTPEVVTTPAPSVTTSGFFF
ncbi:DUF3150 domain-containing protein [Vibrio alginolyticus]